MGRTGRKEIGGGEESERGKRRGGDWPFSEGKNGHFSPKNGHFFCFLPYLLTKFSKNLPKWLFWHIFSKIWQFFYFLTFFVWEIFLSGGGTEGGKIDLSEPGRG